MRPHGPHRHEQRRTKMQRFMIEREIPGASELTTADLAEHRHGVERRGGVARASRTPGSPATWPATRCTASTRRRTSRPSSSTPAGAGSPPTPSRWWPTSSARTRRWAETPTRAVTVAPTVTAPARTVHRRRGRRRRRDGRISGHGRLRSAGVRRWSPGPTHHLHRARRRVDVLIEPGRGPSGSSPRPAPAGSARRGSCVAVAEALATEFRRRRACSSTW